MFVGGSESLLAEIERLVDERKPSLLVTPNVDQVLQLQSDQLFAAVYGHADLRVLDGMPLVLLARLIGARDAVRHTGADLLPLIASVAVRYDWRLVLAGGRPEIAAQAVSRIRSSNPGLEIQAVEIPVLEHPADPASVPSILALREARPDIVFLGLGSPKQELWFGHWQSELPAAVYVGSGAAADFAAGTVRRAPRIVQSMSLEWAWRLAQEPRRLARRYLIRGPRFVAVALRSIREDRRQRYRRGSEARRVL